MLKSLLSVPISLRTIKLIGPPYFYTCHFVQNKTLYPLTGSIPK
ncbi:hypothetical protein SAMN05421545_2730 [Pontibacter lucknowensis]|uniref:Uncharacterized protein n=1 Tax=Pontibacter lucknowensis TaxID=1077936 RepID=A0A1N6Z3U2_9BACT|nr:hypothetical protein SAMN05421545_2730 [Pontibacter lucknowensis]